MDIHTRLRNVIDDMLATSNAEQRAKWARFYPDAWVWCVGVAGEAYPETDVIPLEERAGRVADCVAALSPLKPWDQNLAMAERAVEWHVSHAPRAVTTGAFVRDAAAHVGAMVSRAAAALVALEGGGPGTGPKVSAFAANIRGDYDRVTIDRHMLAMLLPDVQPTPKRVRDVADAVRAGWEYRAGAVRSWRSPAELQAILWGWHREQKGLPAY